jgi:hypothetical protein
MVLRTGKIGCAKNSWTAIARRRYDASVRCWFSRFAALKSVLGVLPGRAAAPTLQK